MTDNAPLLAAFIPLLDTEEGCRLAAYKDTRGIWTIGWGRADAGVTEGMTCTQAQADQWRDEHVLCVIASLDAALPWWRSLSIARQCVVLSMAYQMGLNGLEAFHHALAAMQAGDFAQASAQMLLSPWAETQTPKRAQQLAAVMRTDTLPTVQTRAA